MRYPGKIKPGKIINKAYTSADFAPTLLGLLGIKDALPVQHGRDDSRIFMDRQALVESDEITYMRAHGLDPGWVAALNDRYKLVLSKQDEPWLFDLEEDPEELMNYYSHPDYQEISDMLTGRLGELMELAGDPLLNDAEIRKWWQ